MASSAAADHEVDPDGVVGRSGVIMWNQGARFLVVVVAVAGALTLGGCTVAVSESPAVDSSATSGRGDLPVGNDPVQLNPAEFARPT